MTTDTIRVLIVDNDAGVRQDLAAGLSGEVGIQVTGQAGDGEEALAQAEELSPDVVLMDLAMPTMEGIEALKRAALANGGPHETDWSHAIAELDRLGYEPAEAEDGDVCYGGDTLDGRSVFGLYGREPITSMPSVEEYAEAFRELESMADVIPGSWQA